MEPGSQFMVLEEVITPTNWTLTTCRDFRNEQTIVFRESTDRRSVSMSRRDQEG